ncbi:MAG: extracellular solute-binding protein, partial [Thermocladium sp.]
KKCIRVITQVNTKPFVIVGILIMIIAISVLVISLNHKNGRGSVSEFPRNVLFIDVADAYSGEANELGSLFQQRFGVPYKVYAEGSFALAREISMGSVPSTAFLSIAEAAYYPNYLGNYSPGWAIAFASDELVIAYSNASLSNPAASRIISELRMGFLSNDTALIRDAFMNLTSGSVLVGVSNPLTDPAGYRAFLSLEIAGYLYAGNSSLFLDRLMDNGGNRSATNAAELVAPLEAGQIQFLFIYRSAAISHGLSYIQLPPQLSLGNPSLNNFYSMFNYSIDGKTFRGGPIYLYVSIPGNTNNESLAQQFIVFLLNDSSLLSKYGLHPLKPALLFTWRSSIPQYVKELMEKGLVSS